MQNNKCVYLIALPFLLVLGYIAYRVFVNGNEELSIWLIPPTVMLAIIYVSQSQITWFFARKAPPKLNEKDRQVLGNHSLLYASLSPEEQLQYEDRISLLTLTRDYKFMHPQSKSLPWDLKMQMVIPIVDYTWGEEEYFINHFQHLVVYPHPFLSPREMENVQVSEAEFDDKVLIFSLDHLLAGFQKSFNVCAYEWARAYLHQKNGSAGEINSEFSPEEYLERDLNINYEELYTYLNREDLDEDALRLYLQTYHREPDPSAA